MHMYKDYTIQIHSETIKSNCMVIIVRADTLESIGVGTTADNMVNKFMLHYELDWSFTMVNLHLKLRINEIIIAKGPPLPPVKTHWVQP